jgi:hypothetical protein
VAIMASSTIPATVGLYYVAAFAFRTKEQQIYAKWIWIYFAKYRKYVTDR